MSATLRIGAMHSIRGTAILRRRMAKLRCLAAPSEIVVERIPKEIVQCSQ
jgi:hypothetical protein